ncbi:PaaI family thioesterase [uncultured Pseudodesulfovibrio sp.]|uniref:PaaI family thioesterase n=1 Tax=uncultured Pseudodesulfovibrio sp. TaxID=2035858 RepID=UPI0029C83E17|nr:PaaI family thioesterase [uncultured Pseudodesulfovibrio sp.]
MPHVYLEQVRHKTQTVNPLFAFLGIEVDTIEPDRAVLRLPAKPELVQGAGMIAGGILATLLDEAMAHAVLAGNPQGTRTATVNMDVRYLRPAQVHDTIICEAHVVKRGSRIIFVEGIARVGDQEVARATASFLPI